MNNKQMWNRILRPSCFSNKSLRDLVDCYDNKCPFIRECGAYCFFKTDYKRYHDIDWRRIAWKARRNLDQII